MDVLEVFYFLDNFVSLSLLIILFGILIKINFEKKFKQINWFLILIFLIFLLFGADFLFYLPA
jgi:hypothetical protein